MTKIKREVPPTATETRKAIEDLFSITSAPSWPNKILSSEFAFTVEEVQASATKLQSGRSPGPDDFLDNKKTAKKIGCNKSIRKERRVFERMEESSVSTST